MIQQLGPTPFFMIFTYIENLWDPFVKTLHTLHVTRLNYPNKI
jgi:hypothetical protein